MVLTTPKQTKDADLQVFHQQAVVAVSGYFYAVNLRPEVHPQHHYVGKDRRCTCGLGADCPAVLAVADYLSRQGQTIRMRELLRRLVQAYEIQGVLALDNSFNRVGLDHVLLVRVATTAVVTAMLGGGR